MTDYFQGVVAEYLRADRGVFVNPEILLQLEPGASPKKKADFGIVILWPYLFERE